MLPQGPRKSFLPCVLVKIRILASILRDVAAKAWHVLDLHVLWCHWPDDWSWWGLEDTSLPLGLRPIVVDAGTGRSSARGRLLVVVLGLRGTGRSSLGGRRGKLHLMVVRDRVQSIAGWGEVMKTGKALKTAERVENLRRRRRQNLSAARYRPWTGLTGAGTRGPGESANISRQRDGS